MKRKANTTPLSKEIIIDEALNLIGEKGVDTFSIRDVAKRLDTYPTAIYWYFKNKNTLLGEIANKVMSSVTPNCSNLDWHDWLTLLFQNYRDAVKLHPNIADLIGGRLLANAYQDPRLLDGVITALLEANCPPSHIVPMYNTVIASMCGFVTMEFGHLPKENAGEWEAKLRGGAKKIESCEYPNLVRFLPQMLNNSFILRWQNGYDSPMDESFNRYVDVFIEGLKRQINELNKTP
ncbi:TetR/AcrR family transcriptional regulator [Vibrio vulnificus]|uniref:TetR/AcrR family transcriptional regulator n=1 Tax=Vibrio vulnificus TaxID=672 RepID=UPI00102902D7|nr:TetR/AcrR family transcriptional regulator [Vibrio vulnificus]EGQ7990763.1 TetR/AcrR family transcriptional regulator [Vibrio vulnificus]EGR0088767.1 TetR/AcrR family transcriptional regulator [Vibrio vulnificus]EGR0106656.1 TetR/AcrR family transcriptional regulator [Vibrio vulnificus]EGR7944003.1 TetR/AcrR family transcriptional regulator [Vibrio vulnificus]EHU9455688.1 TetR/AcrR family transcriptional regulator [Vibrio vulnificus]